MKHTLFLLIFFLIYNSVGAQICGTPGQDGSGNISRSINTYYPSVPTQTLNAGDKSISLAAVPVTDAYNNNFGAVPIKKGDLLLVIQMQDATINFSNNANYGADIVNSGPDGLGGTGFTNIGNSGIFEYTIATSDVPLSGGTLTLRAAGLNKGLVFPYVNAPANNTRGKRTFQVVRVPQYSNLVLGSNIITPPFNGTAGGIIAFDVSGNMNFNRFTIDASEKGFRGGYGLRAGSGNNINNLYVAPSTSTASSGKGESIAGTPKYMWDGYNEVINNEDGLPGGSFGRGAPANGGGGGNDHNGGGGGGGNGGYGGVGGNGTANVSTGPTAFPNGGRPGERSFTNSPNISRLIMGGGGGGGDANDALSGVKGGVGGGLVLINVGRISGTGVILANGGNGAVGAAGNNPDGAGGGGAGGTVFIKVSTPDPAAVLNIQVKGGNGGNTERDGRANNEHGTGGGGGGGLVFYTTAAGTLTTNVSQGLSGITNSGNGTKNGARDGTEGLAIPFDNSNLQFYLSGGGEACYPQLTTTMKLSSASSSAFRKKTFVYEARITNSGNGGNAGGVKLLARFPKEFLLKNVSATVSGDAGRTYSVESSNLLTNNLDVVIGDFNISPGDYVTFSLTLEAGCNNPAGLQNSSAQAIYLDPTRTAADPNRLITALTNSFDGNTTYESNPIAVPGLNYNGTMSNDEDVTIIATPPLINSITMSDGNPTLCDSGNPGLIAGPVSGGNGDYTYQWQSSSDGVTFTDILSASQASFDPEPITSTTFYRRKVISACVNDVSSNIISILVAPTPVADFEMPDFCLDDGLAVFTNKSSITDGTQGQLNYLWDYGDGSPATSSSNHTYTSAGEFTVKLTVTSVHGCVAIISKIFTVHGSNPLAKFNFSQLCSNSEVVFEDAAEQTSGQITKIEWFFDVDNHPSDPLYTLVDENPEIRQQARKREYKFKYPDFSAPESKTVNVKMKVYSGQSCTNEVIKTITLYASPEVRFDPVAAVCEAVAPFTITQAREIKGLSGNGIYSGNGITATGIFNPLLAGVGVHAITYTFSTDNCSASETILITVKSSPIAQAGRNLEVLANGQIMLPAVVNGNNLTYQWTPALGLDNPQILNPVASPKEDTEYKLNATSDEGCEVEVFYKVIVLKELKIPNTFTPNGDGTNDYWEIPHLNTYPGVTVQVFNRYGQVVFDSKGYPNPWNGNWNNQNLPAGTYYYLINPQQGLKVVSGSITIIR